MHTWIHFAQSTILFRGCRRERAPHGRVWGWLTVFRWQKIHTLMKATPTTPPVIHRFVIKLFLRWISLLFYELSWNSSRDIATHRELSEFQERQDWWMGVFIDRSESRWSNWLVKMEIRLERWKYCLGWIIQYCSGLSFLKNATLVGASRRTFKHSSIRWYTEQFVIVSGSSFQAFVYTRVILQISKRNLEITME